MTSSFAQNKSIKLQILNLLQRSSKLLPHVLFPYPTAILEFRLCTLSNFSHCENKGIKAIRGHGGKVGMRGWIAGGLEELDVWCQGLVGFWVCGGYVCMCVHVGETRGHLDFHAQGKHDDNWPQFCFGRTLWTNIYDILTPLFPIIHHALTSYIWKTVVKFKLKDILALRRRKRYITKIAKLGRHLII